ncbi:MAG: hypothetical protein Tsb0020_47930 [Haliangiales bacterium]
MYQNLSLSSLATLLCAPEFSLGPALERAFEESPIRLPRSSVRAAVEPLARGIYESLGLALAVAHESGGDDALAPGSAAIRELEKAVSFAGAALASTELGPGQAQGMGFNAAVFMFALRDVVVEMAAEAHRPALRRLFEWLLVIALDSLAGARVMAARERVQEQLEAGTPVVLVAPGVPAALLVGEPSGFVLDVLFGRAVLLVVTQGAPALIIDVSGLADPCAPSVLAGLARLAAHEHIAGAVELVVVGLADEASVAAWRRVCSAKGTVLHCRSRFSEAVELALERGGCRITGPTT